MNFIKIFGILIFIFCVFNVSAEEQYYTLNTDTYSVNIISPITMELNTNFKISPESIVIREKNDIDIIGGQSIISRYDFENKLDYSVVAKYELNLNITEKQKDQIAIYFAEELSSEICSTKNGNILKYNDQRIIVSNKDGTNEKYLCYFKNTNNYYFSENQLIAHLDLNPGKTNVYLLIVTTPAISFDSNINKLVFVDTVKIDKNQDPKLTNTNNQNINLEEFGPISTNDTNQSIVTSLRDIYNNQARRKINNNYSDNNNTEIETNTPNTQQLKQDLSDKTDLKSKATALVTLTPSKSVIFGVGLILLLVGIYLIYKKKKEKNLSNIN